MKQVTILGLAAVCAFAFDAVIGAAGASAAVETTTAWTCVKGGNEGEPGHTSFSDPDCEKAEAGEFGHKTIPPKTPTELKLTRIANSVFKNDDRRCCRHPRIAGRRMHRVQS